MQLKGLKYIEIKEKNENTYKNIVKKKTILQKMNHWIKPETDMDEDLFKIMKNMCIFSKIKACSEDPAILVRNWEIQYELTLEYL